MPNAMPFDRYRDRCERRGECLEFTGSRDQDGYGLIRANSRLVRTHRLAWELANGPIPPGLFVLHTCDNPPCCELTHLYLGTRSDNMRDRADRGRQAGGWGCR